MPEIIFLMGKSATGKDHIYEQLAHDEQLHLKRITMYTTRPMRAGEAEGVEYHFVNDDEAARLEKEGKIIEMRCYDTVIGVWKYFTADTEATELAQQDYLGIGVLESYLALRDYYGAERVVPLYIEVEDGERLQRALDRERAQQEPKYAELCRRFLADSEDFAEEKIAEAGIEKRFRNRDLKESIEEISEYIKEHK